MIELKFDQKKIKTAVVGDKIWFQWDGETFSIPTAQALKAKTKTARGKATSGLGSGQILAPMPGKITQVQAVVGSLVKVGQVILVMEAMKMEYTLKASQAGVLISVHCKVGEQVAAETLLAEIESVVDKKDSQS